VRLGVRHRTKGLALVRGRVVLRPSGVRGTGYAGIDAAGAEVARL
jgi:hypothetical protein